MGRPFDGFFNNGGGLPASTVLYIDSSSAVNEQDTITDVTGNYSFSQHSSNIAKYSNLVSRDPSGVSLRLGVNSGFESAESLNFGTSGGTFEAYVHADTASGAHNIISAESSGEINNFFMGFTSTTIIAPNATKAATMITPHVALTWEHVGFKQVPGGGADNIEVYLDYVLQDSYQITANILATNLLLGGSTYDFNGYVDSLAIQTGYNDFIL